MKYFTKTSTNYDKNGRDLILSFAIIFIIILGFAIYGTLHKDDTVCSKENGLNYQTTIIVCTSASNFYCNSYEERSKSSNNYDIKSYPKGELCPAGYTEIYRFISPWDMNSNYVHVCDIIKCEKCNQDTCRHDYFCNKCNYERIKVTVTCTSR